MPDDFDKRLYSAGQAVYEAMEAGEYRGQGAAPIEPALMDAHLQASQPDNETS